MPDRFYVTTAIAYANNRPGLHTLHEVIAADALARWYRMRGVPTRFLTGTDEHSVNIATKAAEVGLTPRAFVDENVALFRAAEDASGDQPRPVHPDDRPGPPPGRPGDGPPGARERRHLRRHLRGLVLPRTRASGTPTDVVETAAGTICPNHPGVPLQWLTERNWFFRLSAYQDRLERWYEEHPDFVQPDYRRNEMLGFIRRAWRTSRSAGPARAGGSRSRSCPTGRAPGAPDGTWDPEAGTIYVWYDALINYITGAGFPDDPATFARWWPADLHLIGKDIARFHTIFWPAMLWSAGLEPPRHVWAHGWLLAAGERMSKSRGNFFDPLDFVRAFGTDGARYVALRDVAFDRDTDVTWDSFIRRYNADLANDFGNLVNRTVSMVNRYLGGARPGPRPAADAPLEPAWAAARDGFAEKLEGCLIHEALAALWELSGPRTGSSTPGSRGPSRRRPGPATPRRRRGWARSSATSSRYAGSSP